MPIGFQIDDHRIVARFAGASKVVRDKLKADLPALAAKVANDARTIASAHIHTFGKKPGQYLASIYGGVSESDTRIVGFVRSGSPLAHLLERGVKPHVIVAKNAKALAFTAGGSPRFAKRVQSPGADAYPVFAPALAQNKGEIVARITADVMGALR